MWPFDLFNRGESRQFTPHDTLPFIRSNQAEQPIALQTLDVQVVVTGLFAQTTQTLTFYNPNNRVLEGDLTLPLAEGAVVCGYALDVNGKLVDGVIVAKEEARRILETEIRKGVDPGLVEQVKGNIYRTRIYPIPPRGTRTIRLVTVSGLTVSGADAAYDLPLAHADQIETVSLRIEVVQAPVEPVLTGLGNLSMNRWEDRWVAEAKLGRGRPSAELQVRLPGLPDHFTTVEETPDGEVFFCVSSREQAAEREQWNPKRVAIAWDASGSRTGGIDKDLALLQALIGGWTGSGLTVDVLVFRDVVETEIKAFEMGEGTDGTALLNYLRAVPLDGGTDLGVLDLSRTPHVDVEGWLLFTDGLGTLGKALPKLGSTRVFTVTSDSESHGALLHHVSAATGGTSVNLQRVPVEVAQKNICEHSEPLRIGSSAGCEGTHVQTAFGRRIITGKLTEGTGSVVLIGPGAPPEPIGIAAKDTTKGQLLARAWAGREAQILALVDGERAESLVSLGRTYGLVTPGTSLLVLESLEQYLEYDIEPPESLSKMRKAFHANKSSAAQTLGKKREKHIGVVLAWWSTRIAWWETDYRPHWSKFQEKIAESEEEASDDEDDGANRRPSRRMARRRSAGAPPPAPQAAPSMSRSLAAPSGAMESLATGAMDMMAAGAAAVGGGGGEPEAEIPASAQASIAIQAWTPDVPYLKAMGADEANAYAVYLKQRPKYASSPSFFLDCADWLLKRDQRELGVRVLSNLAELGLGDAALSRMFAWRLQQAGELDRAVEIFEGVREIREDEPQSHRDLALALGLRWEKYTIADDAERAMALLYEVIQRSWDRFPEIEVIALMELNRLVHLATKRGVEVPSQIDKRLLRHLDLDVRISLAWDADLTDIDLHVFEPSGEHAYYGHNRTQIGGLVSRDFTQGYGPEEYVLRRAMPGEYTIKAHYYGSHQQTLTGPCTVIVNVFTNYGRPDEVRQVLTLRLEKAGNDILIGKITIDPAGTASNKTDSKADVLAPFKALKKHMTTDDVTSVLGQPVRISGGDQMVLMYEPADGVVVEVVLGPRLVAVRHVMAGATLDLI